MPTAEEPANEASNTAADYLARSIVYLQHEAVVIPIPHTNVSLKVFGSPYSPARGERRWASQYDENEAEALWDVIPLDTDILVTHTPPAGYCDESAHWTEGGCPALTKALARVKPLLHVCGHCHEGRGATVVRWAGGCDNATGSAEARSEVSVRTWEDPGRNNKKQSLLDLTGRRGEQLRADEETAVINAAIVARSFGRGAKAFNKPIVVDVDVPQTSQERWSGD